MARRKYVWEIGVQNLRASYEKALAERRAVWEIPLAKLVAELGRPLTYEEAYAFAADFDI